jgi:hypothetical protein
MTTRSTISPYAVNTWHNRFEEVSIQVPNVSNAVGIYLDGAGPNTCFSLFENTYIAFVAPSSGTNVFGIYWRWCDNNRWLHTEFLGSHSGSGATYPLYIDNSSGSGKPVDNCLDGVDFGSSSATIQNSGSGNATFPNRIVNISAGNGRPADPGITGLDWGYKAAGTSGA